MNSVAAFLTGFKATVLGLLIFVTYRFFEVQSLFNRYLPLDTNIKLFASYLVALVVVFSLLIFSSNLQKFRLNKTDTGDWIKWVLFLFTLLINAYFWELWNGESELASAPLTITFKIAVAIFFAIFDFAYNHLFVSSWADKQALSKSLLSLSDVRAEESELRAKVSELSTKISNLIAKQDPKVCPRCSQEFDHVNQRNGHLRSCKKTIIE